MCVPRSRTDGTWVSHGLLYNIVHEWANVLLPQSCCRVAGMPLVFVCIGLHYSTLNAAARLYLSVSLHAPPHEPVVGLLERGYIAYIIPPHFLRGDAFPPMIYPMEAAKTIAQAFISCGLDYYNSLFYGISDSLIQHLQSVQNAAAHLVTGTRRCDHITPVLRQLHWLPVRQRIHFKITRWVFQAVIGQASARRRLPSDIRLGPLQTRLFWH